MIVSQILPELKFFCNSANTDLLTDSTDIKLISDNLVSSTSEVARGRLSDITMMLQLLSPRSELMPKKNIRRLCGHGVPLFSRKGRDEQSRMLSAGRRGGSAKRFFLAYASVTLTLDSVIIYMLNWLAAHFYIDYRISIFALRHVVRQSLIVVRKTNNKKRLSIRTSII